MHKLLLVLPAVLGLAHAAFAKEYKLPDEESAYASVEIPDDWKSETYDKGVEAVSEDGEVYLAIEAVGGESLDKSIEEALEYLKKQGVTVDDSTAETEESKLGDMDVVYTNWAGKDEDGPCRVALSIVAVSKGKGLMVIYWASPEGGEKNMPVINDIANSIKPL
jgi:hypothetical protein